MTDAIDNGELWVPFGMDADETAVHTALRADIPDWLTTSLWNWIEQQFTRIDRSDGFRFVYPERVRRCERALHVTINWNGDKFESGKAMAAIRAAYRPLDDVKILQLVDFCLAEYHSAPSSSLETILVESGSLWTAGVRNGKPGLVRRMPEGVVEAAQSAFSDPDAGKRLAAAWESAFGLDPDPEAAYSRAVKAVEDAAIRVVSPKNTTATLGTVIRDIRNSGKFSLPNLREHKDARTHDVLLSMLQMLWTGQHDRHGGQSSVSVPNVTQEEAEAAVVLAVTLVGWFSTGKVQE